MKFITVTLKFTLYTFEKDLYYMKTAKRQGKLVQLFFMTTSISYREHTKISQQNRSESRYLSFIFLVIILETEEENMLRYSKCLIFRYYMFIEN